MVSRRVLFTAAALALTVSTLFAEDPAPPGKLQIHVAISPSPDYIKEWTRTPSSHPIVIKRFEKMRIGQTAYIAFIISGHVADERGYPDISVDFVMRKPDGSSMFEEKGYATVKYQTGQGGFVMADPGLDVILDSGDPVGLYRVEATAFDRRAKTSATGFSTVEVVSPSHATAQTDTSPFRSESEFVQWTQNYYQSPSPDHLTAGIAYFSNLSLFDNRDARMLMAQFFASAYGSDAARLRGLLDTPGVTTTTNSRVFVLHVLWLVDTDTSRALLKSGQVSWPEAEIQSLLKRMNEQRPRNLLIAPVQSAADLDMLWSAFFATGDSRPIEQIASVLSLVKEGHGLDIVLGAAAQWSLQSNATQHERVLAIVEELSRSASGTMKQLLEEIAHSAQTNTDA